MKFCPECRRELAKKMLGGANRLACTSHTCGYVYWNNPIPVVAAVVEHDGMVILTRNKGWPESWRGIVAGFLENGENPEEGVLREVLEELGLEGEIVSFIGHYAFRLRNQLILAYHVVVEGEIVLGDELESIRHVHPDDLEPWPIGTGPALKDWLDSRKLNKPAPSGT